MKIGTYGQMGVTCIFVIMVGLLWLVVPSYFFIIKKCSVGCDALLSTSVQKALIGFVEECSLNKPFHKLSFNAIKNKFPMISQIDGNYSVDGHLQCSLKTVRPLVRINDHYLLMEDNSIQDCEDFSPQIISDLPKIMIDHENVSEFSDEYKKCLKILPYNLFERFTVRWVDHTNIYLSDKLLANIVVKADCQSILDNRLFNKYESIKKEIMRQRHSAKKQWILDVRFKNQVIVAQKSLEGL